MRALIAPVGWQAVAAWYSSNRVASRGGMSENDSANELAHKANSD